MKKLLLILSFLVPLFAGAQGLGNASVDLGIKLGANFTNIDGYYWQNGYKANFLGGVFLGVNGPRFGVQIEGLFTQSTYVTGKGFYQLYQGFYQNVSDSAQSGTFRINNFSIPILLNIRIMSRVWLQLGPQYSGIVSVDDADHLMKDAQKLFKNGTLSAVGGLAIKLPLHLTVCGRYVMGLSNFNNNYDYTKTSNNIKDDWKQRTLQVTVGYTFL